MPRDNWARFAPLTGLIFVVLIVIGFLLPGETPETDATLQEVQTFYSDKSDEVGIASFLVALAVPFLVFFGSILHRTLRLAGSRGRLAGAAFGGALLAAAGFSVAAAVGFATAEAGDKTNTIAAVQPLHVLSNESWIPFVTGMAILLLASGLAILRYGGMLPRWLGWAGAIIGLAMFIPFVGFIAFLLSGIWIVAASVILYLAGPLPDAGPAAPTQSQV